MKKLGVNGRTFDEIFEERGEITSMDNFSKSSIFFCEEKPNADYAAIYDFEKNMVVEDGSYVLKSYYGDYIFDGCVIREATPNQIALLNLYKEGVRND